MTIRTRAQLNSDATTNLADNTTRDISAEDVRQRVKDLADSAQLAEDLGTAAYVAVINNATNDWYPDYNPISGSVIPRLNQNFYWVANGIVWEGVACDHRYAKGFMQAVIQSKSLEVLGQKFITLAVNAASGASTITVSDDADIVDGETIFVYLDDGTGHLTYVNGTPVADVV